MNKKYAKLTASLFCCFLAMTACNGDDDNMNLDEIPQPAIDSQSSTAINSFNIKPNSKVLAHLDSVFFTIDLINGRIFNADSLPYGTNVSKLVMNLGSETVSKITVKFTDLETSATKEVDYTTSSSDSVNFNAPVTITVLSANELYERVYDVSVNVHQVKADSLCWGSLEYAQLPAPAVATEQKTVSYDGKVYCLTSTPEGYYLAVSDNPAYVSSWNISPVSFVGFTPDVNSFSSTSQALYVLSAEGRLYTSVNGLDWESCGLDGWVSIIGGYGDMVVGVKCAGGVYSSATYPTNTAVESTSLPDGFPMTGHSPVVSYTSQWSAHPQMITVGGRCADGSLSSAAWGFDGTAWTKFGNLPKNMALEGVTLIPYTTFTTNTVNWTVKSYPSLYVMGGRNSDGETTRCLYYSRDWGLNWHTPDEYLSLPEDMPTFAYAQGVVVDFKYGDDVVSPSGWNAIGTPTPNPLWWSIDMPGCAASRAVSPITSWDCPYIYLFGGVGHNGQLNNTVWRGAINRLTFKPLQ